MLGVTHCGHLATRHLIVSRQCGSALLRGWRLLITRYISPSPSPFLARRLIEFSQTSTKWLRSTVLSFSMRTVALLKTRDLTLQHHSESHLSPSSEGLELAGLTRCNECSPVVRTNPVTGWKSLFGTGHQVHAGVRKTGSLILPYPLLSCFVLCTPTTPYILPKLET